MRKRRTTGPPRITQTIYVEVGIANALDHLSQRLMISRNEATVRALKRGIASFIADATRGGLSQPSEPTGTSSGPSEAP